MNEKLKQRLIGAVVLVSLAVIFIPIMLDGGEQSSMPMYGSNIPDKPDYQFEPLDIPLQPVTTVAEGRPVLIDKPEPAPKKVPPAKEKPTGATALASAEPTSRPPALVNNDPAAIASQSASSTTAADSEPGSWVVQVGSFSLSTNALTLRDKLRAKGFTAFVEKLNSGGDTIYRVRIGPELKKENANKQLQRLQRLMGMKGIVMGHNR